MDPKTRAEVRETMKRDWQPLLDAGLTPLACATFAAGIIAAVQIAERLTGQTLYAREIFLECTPVAIRMAQEHNRG